MESMKKLKTSFFSKMLKQRQVTRFNFYIVQAKQLKQHQQSITNILKNNTLINKIKR